MNDIKLMPQTEQMMQTLIKSIDRTNDIVQQLSTNVSELVIADRERILNDKRQQEINLSLEKKIESTNENIKDACKKYDDVIDANRDTLVRAKRFHTIADKISIWFFGAIVIGLLTLLGFNFK